jgi:hypothetical protein
MGRYSSRRDGYDRLQRSESRRVASGLNASLGRLVSRYPFPTAGLFLAAGALLTYEAAADARVVFVLAIPFGILLLLSGVFVLAAGLVKSARRNLHPIVLTCPKCSIESRTLARPFSVERWSDVDYAFIVCSHCGNDFTVAADSKLL